MGVVARGALPRHDPERYRRVVTAPRRRTTMTITLTDVLLAAIFILLLVAAIFDDVTF